MSVVKGNGEGGLPKCKCLKFGQDREGRDAEGQEVKVLSERTILSVSAKTVFFFSNWRCNISSLIASLGYTLQHFYILLQLFFLSFFLFTESFLILLLNVCCQTLSIHSVVLMYAQLHRFMVVTRFLITHFFNLLNAF